MSTVKDLQWYVDRHPNLVHMLNRHPVRSKQYRHYFLNALHSASAIRDLSQPNCTDQDIFKSRAINTAFLTFLYRLNLI
jgi:hypothetical protein